MKSSQSIVKISIALLSAQRKIGSAVKDSVNPFFHSNYADLGAVMEACKEALNEQGISVLQPIGTNEFGTYVETVLLHESGEWISDSMKIASKTENNPQDQGSAITYARRYSLQSMVFIPAEDDDGNTASGNKDKKVAPKAPTAKAGDEPAGNPVPPRAPLDAKDKITGAQLGKIGLLATKDLGYSGSKVCELIEKLYGVKMQTELSKAQASNFIERLLKQVDEREKAEALEKQQDGVVDAVNETQPVVAGPEAEALCDVCKKPVSDRIKTSSLKKYNKVLCMTDQLKEKAVS